MYTYVMREIRMTLKWLIHIQISKSLLWIRKIDRLLLQMFLFCSDAGAPPQSWPTGRAHNLTQALCRELLFLNSEEFNFTICFRYSFNCTKSIAARAPSQTPLVELTQLPGKLLFVFQKFVFHQMPNTSLKCAKLFGSWGSAPELIRRAI